MNARAKMEWGGCRCDRSRRVVRIMQMGSGCRGESKCAEMVLQINKWGMDASLVQDRLSRRCWGIIILILPRRYRSPCGA
jgi:hypothetical protein